MFLHSVSSLAYDIPSTVVLILNDYVPSLVIIAIAMIFEVIYYNTVVRNMEKYQTYPKELWKISTPTNIETIKKIEEANSPKKKKILASE